MVILLILVDALAVSLEYLGISKCFVVNFQMHERLLFDLILRVSQLLFGFYIPGAFLLLHCLIISDT